MLLDEIDDGFSADTTVLKKWKNAFHVLTRSSSISGRGGWTRDSSKIRRGLGKREGRDFTDAYASSLFPPRQQLSGARRIGPQRSHNSHVGGRRPFSWLRRVACILAARTRVGGFWGKIGRLRQVGKAVEPSAWRRAVFRVWRSVTIS